MKTINLKSVIIGVFLATCGFALISSAPAGSNNSIELVAHPGGIGVFNQQTKTLHMYRMVRFKLEASPYKSYLVDNGGESLVDIE